MFCCYLIVMVENTNDDPFKTKLSFVNSSIEFKPTKVETSIDEKPNIDEAFVNVKALHVDYGVS